MGAENESPKSRMTLCLERAGLPMPRWLLNAIVSTNIMDHPGVVKVDPKLLGNAISLFHGSAATAVFEGEEKGCRLLTDREKKGPAFLPAQSS